MLEWMKRRGSAAPSQDKREVGATTRHASRTAGRYRFLYEYLEQQVRDVRRSHVRANRRPPWFHAAGSGAHRPGMVDDCRPQHGRSPLLGCMDTGQQNGQTESIGPDRPFRTRILSLLLHAVPQRGGALGTAFRGRRQRLRRAACKRIPRHRGPAAPRG
jgi:hypothetical protein